MNSTSRTERSVSNRQRIPNRTPSGPALLFARNFFRHPRMLGSIVPSSRFLTKQLLEPIDWSRARVIVEYGPGVGGITAESPPPRPPDARLIPLENNPEFLGFLRATNEDERLHL